MIVNIYGRHPSIADATPTPCDLSISINHTGRACDWLCFGDVEALGWFADGTWPRTHRIGLIGPASFEFVHPIPSLGLYLTWQCLGSPVKSRKSSIVALWAALRFGATDIRTWGVRMEGDRDVDGLPSQDNVARGAEDRWRRERIVWDMVCRHAPAGVTVTRH